MEEAKAAIPPLLNKCKSLDAKLIKLPASSEELVCCSYTELRDMEYYSQSCALSLWTGLNKLVLPAKPLHSCVMLAEWMCVLSNNRLLYLLHLHC